MVHLLPLPGAPDWDGSMERVLAAAVRDATALAEGGVDGIMVENYGDAPFLPGPVPAHTIAALSNAVLEVRRAVQLPVGVNVLRNDAAAAIGICAATGASFVRINVHTGAMLTDQGWIEGAAYETLRLRRQLAIDVVILADVFVKHATPPQGLTLQDAARDTWHRGQADALIVSGSGTGEATSAADVQDVRAVLPEAPVLIGSGLTVQNAAQLLAHADGAIVGTALKTDGRASSAVSRERVRQLVEAVARSGPTIA